MSRNVQHLFGTRVLEAYDAAFGQVALPMIVQDKDAQMESRFEEIVGFIRSIVNPEWV